jgi:choline kinase
MQAIIIAAGLGRRLKPLTDHLPKCMLEIDGKSIIQHQVNTLRSAGVEKIAIIKGYCEEKVQLEGQNLEYFLNSDYKYNNILESLFCAEEVINDEVIILYSDIIFEKSVVERLLKSHNEISIVVDVGWKDNYIDRRDHPLEEAEGVILDDNSQVCQIGKIVEEGKAEVSGEFIGMMKLCGQGSEIFKSFYHKSRKLYKEKPFQRAQSIRVAYLTDMIQELADNAVPVFCVKINNGWKEIDTMEDLTKAADFFKNTWP